MKRTRLKPVSDKRKAINAIYLRQRRKFLSEHPICEFKKFEKCKHKSRDVHHMQGRGANLCREETWMAVCRLHHDWIHAHPRDARSLGFLK